MIEQGMLQGVATLLLTTLRQQLASQDQGESYPLHCVHLTGTVENPYLTAFN